MGKRRRKKSKLLWQCRVCGYIHEGPEPPEICPVCGADRTAFRPIKR